MNNRSSFSSNYSVLGIDKGVPIGNLTSQLFANIYLNELDKFLKQGLKVKYYLRYTDDFLIISENKEYLEKIIPELVFFLEEKLLLKIHFCNLYNHILDFFVMQRVINCKNN